MGLGTWSWGNQFVWQYEEENDPELRRVFDAAVAAGVNVFDTADSYGTGSGLDGRSEVLLGQFLKQYPDREAAAKVNIATKFAAYPWRVTPGSVVKAARESRGGSEKARRRHRARAVTLEHGELPAAAGARFMGRDRGRVRIGRD